MQHYLVHLSELDEASLKHTYSAIRAMQSIAGFFVDLPCSQFLSCRCLEEGAYPGCLWPTVKAIKICECRADHSRLSIPLLAQFTMEDHDWYILGILDEVINLR